MGKAMGIICIRYFIFGSIILQRYRLAPRLGLRGFESFAVGLLQFFFWTAEVQMCIITRLSLGA